MTGSIKKLALLAMLLLSTEAQFAGRLFGVNYSLRIGPDWESDDRRCKSADRVRSELSLLKNDLTDNVRVFSMTDCDTAKTMLEITQELGMGLWLGVWVGPEGTVFEEERARMLQLMQSHNFSHVMGIHVSSEAIYRDEITPEQAMNLHFAIREDVNAGGLQGLFPVTISDIIDTNLEFPELIKIDPQVVSFNMFPFWERSVDINNAAQYMEDRVALVEQQAEGRVIVITETGWADAGVNKDSNVANPESMAKWMRDFICLAHERGWGYFWFTAFDSDWRRVNEESPDDVEGHFGLYDEAGVLKENIRELLIDCSQPRQPVDLFSVGTTGAGTPGTPGPTPFTRIANPSPSPIPMIADPTFVPVQPISLRLPPPTAPFAVTTDVFPTPLPSTSPPVVTSEFPPTDPSLFPTPPLPTTGPPLTSANRFPTPAPTFDVASIFAPTTESGRDASCSANVLCSARGLEGECCPTENGVNLDCCGSIILETCIKNPVCENLGLEGACCPTNDKTMFLDCCESVPDICQGGSNSECFVFSALEYKASLNGDASARSASGGNWSAGLALSLAFLMAWGR